MIGHTDNSIHIAAPVDVVWRLTNELERWTELFTEYAAVEIIERGENTVRFRLTMHPDANGNAWTWVSERRMDPASYTVTARRIELGWFDHMRITWTYTPEAGGTRMRWVQQFAMAVSSPVSDEAMTEHIDTNTVMQMAHVRDVVERLAAPAAHH